MGKTLIIDSTTDQEDLEALRHIISACASEKVTSVTWYSNIGKKLAQLESRLEKIEKKLGLL